MLRKLLGLHLRFPARIPWSFRLAGGEPVRQARYGHILLIRRMPSLFCGARRTCKSSCSGVDIAAVSILAVASLPAVSSILAIEFFSPLSVEHSHCQ